MPGKRSTNTYAAVYALQPGQRGRTEQRETRLRTQAPATRDTVEALLDVHSRRVALPRLSTGLTVAPASIEAAEAANDVSFQVEAAGPTMYLPTVMRRFVP